MKSNELSHGQKLTKPSPDLGFAGFWEAAEKKYGKAVVLLSGYDKYVATKQHPTKQTVQAAK